MDDSAIRALRGGAFRDRARRRSKAFAKAATDERTAVWLRNERRLLGLVGRSLGPEVLAWEDGGAPLLVTEDLSRAYWPAADGENGQTRWRPGDVEALLEALGELRRLGPLSGELPTAPWPGPTWEALLSEGGLARSGLCAAGWLRRNGAVIADFDKGAAPVNGSLVHGDVRSDNLCLLADGSVRLVDWSESGCGDPHQDLVQLLPTLHLEGGPEPASVLTSPAGPIVRLGGAAIHQALHRTSGPAWLRRVLLRLAAINLDWMAAALDLEPPNHGEPLSPNSRGSLKAGHQLRADRLLQRPPDHPVRWRSRRRNASLFDLPSPLLGEGRPRRGWTRAWVGTTWWSAAFGLRSPIRESRCRRTRPEETSIGSQPAWRASWASVAKRAPPVSTRRLAAIGSPTPGMASRPGGSGAISVAISVRRACSAR